MDRFLALPLAILIAYAGSASASTEISCADVVSISLSGDTDYFGKMDGTESKSKFYVNNAELDYASYDSLDFHCKGTVTTSTSFSANFALGLCNPHVTANDTYINYEYKVWNKPMLFENGSPSIARYAVTSVRVDCIYTRVMTDKTTDNWIVPNIVKTNIWDGTSMYEGTFTFSLKFYESDSYSTEVSSSKTVDVNSWMYIGLKLDDGSADSSNFIAFKDCYAKESAAGSSNRYDLIKSYAVSDESWDQAGSIIMEASGSANMAKLKVKSFVWNDAEPVPKIYVQCDATVCNSGVTDNCVNYVDDGSYAATNRRRRRRRDTGSEQVVTLMAGPMEVM